jgi:Tfp pilus assembly protein PilP
MSRLQKSSFVIGVCLFLGVSCAYAQSPKAQPAVKKEAAREGAAKKYNVEDFTYSAEGRDPFEPVLLLKAKTSRGLSVSAGSSKEKKEPERVGYELEELRFVGVIKSGTGMIAMMEDMQGKGIFFRKGDHLNKNMWVMDVSASNMVVGYKSKGETKKIVVDIPSKN